jgi:hypothetical protein
MTNEEYTEDIQKIGGTEALDEPYLDIAISKLVRKRAGWLVLLFIGEMLTATAMQFFQGEIEKVVVLSLFIPLIVSSGGNSGSQASTLGDPDPFGSHYSVSDTGLTGCPESAPPTTYRTAYLYAFGFTGSSHTYSEVMTDTCGKNPSNVIGTYTGLTSGGSSALYVDESVIVPGTIYQLWNSNISGGGSHVVGEGKYYAILIFGEGSTFRYIVYIDSEGIVSEWHTCP